MPRRLREKLTEEERKKRRREQKKVSMRRARSKLNAEDIEERRRKDRERYQEKKDKGLIKTIADFTPRDQRKIRKIWREKSKLQREKEKLKKRAELITKENIPASTLKQSPFSRKVAGHKVSAKNRRKLKTANQRLSNRVALLEKKLAKYRMRLLRLKRKKELSATEKQKEIIKKQALEFYLDDENSRLTAGKKETITRRGIKKQIRLLNDTIFNLHKIFINETGYKISYNTFRKCRPFWVIFPKSDSRNTCLCSLHTNNNLMTQALNQAKILSHSSATDVAKYLCCDNITVSCLERKCMSCKSKDLIINNIPNESDTILYQRWVTKNVSVTIKGVEKTCKKTIKETVKTTKKLLLRHFKENLPKFMQHLANIRNQFNVIRSIKQNMSPDEGLLHIDFSENYACKYGEEIQSAHFGGSKAQLSLHTCVYYSINPQPPANRIRVTSICTVSENLRHDPVLICTHLKPVLEKILLITPGLRTLHILSDGPSTQYRNKTMFSLIPRYISKISKADTIIWHFSETGHGKGAPDGVGGCIKRTCDKAVANGRDVAGIDSFVNCLKHSIKNIDIIRVNDEYVGAIQQVADASKIRPFRGTFQVHQVAWSNVNVNTLHARRLSCITCPAYDVCPHFEIGQIMLPNERSEARINNASTPVVSATDFPLSLFSNFSVSRSPTPIRPISRSVSRSSITSRSPSRSVPHSPTPSSPVSSRSPTAFRLASRSASRHHPTPSITGSFSPNFITRRSARTSSAVICQTLSRPASSGLAFSDPACSTSRLDNAVADRSSSSDSSAASIATPPSPTMSALTPDASTVTGPGTPPDTPTPDPPTNIRQPLTPKKRSFENIFSDESNSPPKKFKKLASFFNGDESSDENIFD